MIDEPKIGKEVKLALGASYANYITNYDPIARLVNVGDLIAQAMVILSAQLRALDPARLEDKLVSAIRAAVMVCVREYKNTELEDASHGIRFGEKEAELDRRCNEVINIVMQHFTPPTKPPVPEEIQARVLELNRDLQILNLCLEGWIRINDLVERMAGFQPVVNGYLPQIVTPLLGVLTRNGLIAFSSEVTNLMTKGPQPRSDK